MTTPAKWKPERVKEVREEIASLWRNAVEAVQRLEEPFGDPAADANRLKARAFAEAHMKSLDRMLAMIDAKQIPTAESWKTWGELNSEANRLWGELPKTQ